MWSATCKTQLHGRPMPAATGCLRGLESDLPIRVSASIPVFNIICIMRNITGVAQGTWNADFCCARGLLRAFRARSLRRISRLFLEVLRALWRPGSTASILPHRRSLFCGPAPQFTVILCGKQIRFAAPTQQLARCAGKRRRVPLRVLNNRDNVEAASPGADSAR